MKVQTVETYYTVTLSRDEMLSVISALDSHSAEMEYLIEEGDVAGERADEMRIEIEEANELQHDFINAVEYGGNK